MGRAAAVLLPRRRHGEALIANRQARTHSRMLPPRRHSFDRIRVPRHQERLSAGAVGRDLVAYAKMSCGLGRSDRAGVDHRLSEVGIFR